TACQCVDRDDQEHDNRCAGKVSTGCGHIVPQMHAVVLGQYPLHFFHRVYKDALQFFRRNWRGIINITTWHTLQAKEVLREEHKVHTKEGDEEVNLTRKFWVLTARHFTNPVIPARKQREHRAE